MKLGKWIIQLGLFLAVVFGLGTLVLPARAATLPAGARAVNTQSAFYKPHVTPVGDSDPIDWSLVTDYPKLAAPIAANNLSPNGRVTNKTTKIYISISGRFLAQSGSNITSVKPFVRNGTKVLGLGTSTVLFPTTVSTALDSYYEIDVDLSRIQDLMPLNIGFAVTYQNSSKTDYLKFAELLEDAELEKEWGGDSQTIDPKMYIDSTIKTDDPTTGNVRKIKGSDKKITGVGYPGLDIELPITDTNGKEVVFNSTVGSDGKFEFDLPDYVGKLTSKTVGVREYNDTGDAVGAVADVIPVLDITTNKQALSIDPDTLEDNIAGKSDSDILKWIAQQAGITVSYLGDQYNLSDVTLKSDQTDLATQIADLANGSSLTVKIGATNSANISTVDTADITLTRTDGALSFTSISPTLEFGSVAVPSQEMLFAPTTQPDISISDTQASGTPWYVMAQATDLTSTDGRKLAGHMVYVDADGDKESMANAVQVATGVRDRKTTYPQNTASKWSTKNQGLTDPATGLYIDALPTVYAGGDTMQYQGTVSWQLTNAPGSVGSDISN
ncbi:MAG: hypothetical protein LKH74_05835 [Levilactobacillus sp.]|jgi:hypothetical protein|uniref:hypothetical protein n=1 Tax=Levilactobacillus sp. TaxID=2767919 RepID=UPI002585E629|nr:hypothetical protein [Levilactobacillus sp.]MCI1553430.1 hypothetical protein [Levilactobacillus sp.]MCI1597819.1 hypothetical protein [Levilactobacillus sp.]MCI1605573.1 hypothetical protein [Levilactobacillus sp.]